MIERVGGEGLAEDERQEVPPSSPTIERHLPSDGGIASGIAAPSTRTRPLSLPESVWGATTFIPLSGVC